MLLVLNRSQLNNSLLSKSEENIIIALIFSYRNTTHRDFFNRKLHVDKNSHSFHLKSLNRIIKMANLVIRGTQLECLKHIPLKSVSGCKFPTLRDIFD